MVALETTTAIPSPVEMTSATTAVANETSQLGNETTVMPENIKLEPNEPVNWAQLLRAIYVQEQRVHRFEFQIEQQLARQQFNVEFFGQGYTNWKPELALEYFKDQVELLNQQLKYLIKNQDIFIKITSNWIELLNMTWNA